MGIFNKKEKQPREIKDDDPLIVKLWYNKRSHAAIVLGLYFIFFALILILVNFAGTTKPKNTTVKGNTLVKLFNYLDGKDVSYNYTINVGGKKYYFSGNNKDDDIYGTILYNGESQSVRISNGECIIGEYNNKGEFVSSELMCPETINYNYFDYNNIYILIKDEEGTDNINGEYYLFNLNDNVSVKLNYDVEKLKATSIENKNGSYLLEYSISEEASDDTQREGNE